MGSLSIIDKAQKHSHLRHFVVQTRTFQIEKARNVDMYENLSIYIKRQNEKKKQEMEMSAELRRARREKELKHKRDKSTLGEIKEEIERERKNLDHLLEEKHRLFVEFKKVLGDDEKRKNLQMAKEVAAYSNLQNITFGPPQPPATNATVNVTMPKPSYPEPNTTASNVTSNSTILPSSLHHLQPIQSMFFAQQQQQQHGAQINTSSANSITIPASHAPSPPSQSSAINHHRLNNERIPTPTTFASSPKHTLSQQQQQQSSPLIYAKPMLPHPTTPLAMTSISSSSSSPSMISTMSSSSSPQFANDRHRLYKRSHDQMGQSPPVSLSMPTSSVLSALSGQSASAINTQPSHLHYLPTNYKPQMNPMQPAPFGQHVMPNLEVIQNHPAFYQQLFPYHGANSYLNPNQK